MMNQLKAKIISIGIPERPVHKIHKSDPTSKDRQRRYYHLHKDEPEFQEMQREKRKRKYDAMKDDPERWAKYLEQCRLSKQRRKVA